MPVADSTPGDNNDRKKPKWLEKLVCCVVPPPAPGSPVTSGYLPRQSPPYPPGPHPTPDVVCKLTAKEAPAKRDSDSSWSEDLGKLSSRNGYTDDLDDDDTWWDARSEFSVLSRTSMRSAGDEEGMASPGLSLSSSVPSSPTLAPWIPNPPLRHVGEGVQFLPVPAVTGFHGYWRKNFELSSPSPMPLDVLFNAGWFTRKTHDSIMWVRLVDTPEVFGVSLKVKAAGAMPIKYRESFTKDSLPITWMMRRDIRTGRTTGQLFYTQDGRVVVRVYSKGLYSDEIDQIVEEYYILEDGGSRIRCLQYGLDPLTGKTAEQVLVAEKMDPEEAV